ncbi:MAG: hypothetical protein HWN67_11095 [Candidatus Helarchaeota archaeon]|nr:hypothetical protein [Candidatus Helarchaeota archaeon]
MKRRYFVLFFSLMVSMVFISLPINSINSNNSFEYPTWLNSPTNEGKTPNTPDIEPITNDKDILESKANQEWGNQPDQPDRFMGQHATNAIIEFNNSFSSYETDPYALFTDIGDIVSPTYGFNLTYVNLTFFNILTQGYYQDVEADAGALGGGQLPYIDIYNGTTTGNPYVMSFRIEHGFLSHMAGLELNLRCPNIAAEIICFVLNSTFNPFTLQVEPHSSIGVVNGSYFGIGWEWVDFDGYAFLNTYDTWNNTFFLMPFVKDVSHSTKVYWNYMSDTFVVGGDGVDEGLAYEFNTGMWNPLPIDFSVKQVDITGCAPPPERIDMRINGTPLNSTAILFSNVTEDLELWAFTTQYFNNSFLDGEFGTIFYDIETNWSSYGRSSYVVFMLNATAGFQNQTNAITRCHATAGNSIVNWNATVQGMYFPKGAYDKKINVTVPQSWNVSEVYENSTKINSSIVANPPYKFVNINATANGTWNIICNGTNWAGNITVYNNTPPFIEAYSYYLNDTIKINGTIYAKSLAKANLTVFNPNNATIYNDQASIINNVSSFTPWRIFDNSTRNGTHHLRVVWFNGTEVGINMTEIECYNEPTNLTVTQGPDPQVVYQGDLVTARIFYNDTYANKSISGAKIDSNWSYSPLTPIDWLNGSYNITFFTGFAPEDNYTIIINATKEGYEAATAIIRFNVTLVVPIEPTELEIVRGIPYAIGEDLYVNDTGKFAIVNYTFQVNRSGIKGADIMTDPFWMDPYFQYEDLSLGNASLKGLYKIWLNTTGTHAYESHRIRFFATKPGLEPNEVISSSFQIYPIPTDIDVTGYENITKFEGEIVNLAACYKDDYHAGKPAITNAVVNWTINTTTPESDDMDLVILIYQGIINLPELEVPPGTYNVSIKAQARDFRPYSKNITLNVLPKWSTLILITNYSSHSRTEIRVGKDVTIEAKIQFGNTSIDHEGRTLNYEIDYSNDFHIEDNRITNINGTTTFVINPIPDIQWINVTVSYDGTPQINASSSNLLINVTGKYETNLTINYAQMASYIISGEEFSINSSLEYNNSGKMTSMQGETIEFIIDYENYQDESLITTTNEDGLAIIDFTPPDGAISVIIRAIYIGNISFFSTNDNTTSFKLTKYNVTLQIFDINPLELMVGSPIILTCELKFKETGLPVSNASVTFFVYMGDPNVRIFQQSAVTDKDGVAFTVLILLQPFEVLPLITVGVEYEGDESTFSSTTTSPLPTIPMTTTKYFTNYINENWWWMAIIIGAVVAISLAYRYGVKLPRRRREIALQKKIANKVKDAQNLKHCIILEKNSGASIFDQGFGDIVLDSDLISGFLTAISAFQTEISVKGKKKAEVAGGFELSYADFKILLTGGELSRFAFILQDKPGDSFREVAQETVNQFESEYGSYLRDWDGALKHFKTANRVLASKFEIGLSQTLRVKMLSEKETKNLSDLSAVLVRIAKSQQEQKGGKFFVDDIMQIAVQARKEPDYEIYYEIYNLYKNRILIPTSKKEALVAAKKIITQIPPIEEKKEVKEEVIEKEQKLIKGIYIPDLRDEEYEILRQEIESMSPANQKIFQERMMYSPDDKRTKIVKKMLSDRAKLRTKLNDNLSEIEKLSKKEIPPYPEIFQKMEAAKRIYEELGNEEKALSKSMDIQKVLEKFDNANEIKNLRNQLADLTTQAKKANENQEFLKAALLYRKAARIYIELGNFEDAEKLGEIASYTEQKTNT